LNSEKEKRKGKTKQTNNTKTFPRAEGDVIQAIQQPNVYDYDFKAP
jgi:hypothetical protein